MNGPRKRLSLAKGREKFVFYYRAGQESAVLAAVLELADDPESPVDWLDAAVLSFQMGRGAARDSEEMSLA